jgi:predicted nucleic acid-binding protein
MKFWDSSALIPLLVPEAMSSATQDVFKRDPVIVVWWATEVECTSAIARQHRNKNLSDVLVVDAYARLDVLRDGWHEVEPGEEIRESARRFLRVHDLRTADALQLAAAYYLAEGRPPTLELVSFDERLLCAARGEGFATLKPGEA